MNNELKNELTGFRVMQAVAWLLYLGLLTYAVPNLYLGGGIAAATVILTKLHSAVAMAKMKGEVMSLADDARNMLAASSALITTLKDELLKARRQS